MVRINRRKYLCCVSVRYVTESQQKICYTEAIKDKEAFKMKGYVDQSLCVGCGMCAGIAPSAFRMNDDGLAEGYAEISAADEAAAQEAKESCPAAAIELKA